MAANELLEVWERGTRSGPHERAVHLLQLALPGHGIDALADFDLGLRDRHLLRLRCAMFGPTLRCFADCPHCDERVEVELDCRALQADEPLPPPPTYVDRGGYRFRLPCSRDLISIESATDTDLAARTLLQHCVIDGRELVDADFDEVDQGLAALAAERNLQLELVCELCTGTWLLDFDPGAYLWEEIHARALTLLDDVHDLATAYRWKEADILALSDARRAAYLARIN